MGSTVPRGPYEEPGHYSEPSSEEGLDYFDFNDSSPTFTLKDVISRAGKSYLNTPGNDQDWRPTRVYCMACFAEQGYKKDTTQVYQNVVWNGYPLCVKHLSQSLEEPVYSESSDDPDKPT